MISITVGRYVSSIYTMTRTTISDGTLWTDFLASLHPSSDEEQNVYYSNSDPAFVRVLRSGAMETLPGAGEYAFYPASGDGPTLADGGVLLLNPPTVPTLAKVESVNGHTGNVVVDGGGDGVTSVGVTAPAILSVSGSPVTSSGTIALALVSQAAHTVLAGPTTGANAAPAMRLLVAADIPSIAESQVTNLATDLAAKVPTSRQISGGSGLSGGGDLSADRSIAMPATGTPGTYGDSTHTLTITTDAQGRVTAVSANAIASGGAGLGTNTFMNTQTINPANNEPAITVNRATAGVGTISTNGSSTITGIGTKFLSQCRAGDTITPSGQSPVTVQWVTSDTSIEVSPNAGSGSGLSYTLGASSFSIFPNGIVSVTVLARSGGVRSEAYGEGASVAGSVSDSLAVGWGAKVTGSSNNNTALGRSANAASGSVAIGTNVTASGTGSLAINSNGSAVTGQASIGVGNTSSVSGVGSLVIGGSGTSQDRVIVLGNNAVPTAAHQAIIGGAVSGVGYIVDLYLNNPTDPTPTLANLHIGGGASGSNVQGGDGDIIVGPSTGNALASEAGLQTGFPTSSGSTAQPLAHREKWLRPKTLTAGVATKIRDVAILNNSIVGGTLYYTISANDGSAWQGLRGKIDFVATNNGGTVHCTGGTPVEITDPNGGITVAGITFTYGTNIFALNINASSTLTSPTITATCHISLDGGSGLVSPL